MRVSEVFYSIQGEGKLAGVPSVFVRASGCNLRCVWCDTPYASWRPEGREMAVGEIIAQVRTYGATHVVLTGGEPLIMPDAAALCKEFKKGGWHVTVETAATVFQSLEMDLASLSPKLSNSTPIEREGGKFAATHEANRLSLPVIQQFIDTSPDFQLKFVVAGESDVAEIRGVLGGLKNWSPSDVLLMPEGTDSAVLDSRSNWIAEICKQHGFRFCPRLHIAMYGNKRGV